MYIDLSWSHESLAEALEESGRVRSISSSTVGRILAEADPGGSGAEASPREELVS
jgi:hypothetical protein